jgi:hypothetical protein
MKKPEPYGDTAAGRRRSADLRFQRYQERIESEAAFFRAKLLTLALLTAMATLVWSLYSTENGKQVCQIISEIFR